MPKVSVIIPIYGVEKYIARCAESLMRQTLDDMEFIFVNDCTKDNSIEELNKVLSRYPQRRSQVNIINKTVNEGVSYARKTGVENSTGEYIGFCDSDDWVEPTMFEKLYTKAINNNLDYVKCGHYVSDGETVLNTNIVKLSEKPDKNEVISKLLKCMGLNSIWDMITKKSVFYDHHIEFTKNAMLEDFFVAAQILEYCTSYGMVKEPLYYYFQNPTSICNVPSNEAFVNRAHQAKDNILWILRFIHERYGESFKKDEVVLKYVPRRIIIPIMSDSLFYPLWKSLFPGNSIAFLCTPYVGLSQKLQYLLVSLKLYPIYKRIIK